MEGTDKPEYGKVVDIVTRDSLRELATPGLLAVFAPIAVGFGLGVGALAGYLAGTIATGTLMAVFLANSGGAWDNAKKFVEDGHHGGKGSDGARGDGHRRHRRRPVQGHRRPGDQPAAQGDEPGRAADRAGRGESARSGRVRPPLIRLGIAARRGVDHRGGDSGVQAAGVGRDGHAGGGGCHDEGLRTTLLNRFVEPAGSVDSAGPTGMGGPVGFGGFRMTSRPPGAGSGRNSSGRPGPDASHPRSR